jgi:hypothetical protein
VIRFKNKTVKVGRRYSIAVSIMFAMTPMAHAVSAPNIFDDNSFKVEYGVSPSDAASFVTVSGMTVIGSASSAEIADLAGWRIDTLGNSLSLTWNKAADFMNSGNPPFIGFKISDPDNHLGNILDVAVTNSAYQSSTYGNLVEGFIPSKVTFDENNIYINLNTSMWHSTPMASMGDPFRDKIALAVDFQALPVPEPETYAMLLAGLGLIGSILRRRRA